MIFALWGLMFRRSALRSLAFSLIVDCQGKGMIRADALSARST